jgi:UDP-N-acetylmuramoyl-tripeptide--D-alanyl-D-alanine ligase
MLWTSQELQKATGGVLHNAPLGVTGVSIDSRTVGKGELYIALKGDAHDGHDFTVKALENGAGLALVSIAPAVGSYLLVDDVMEAMRAIARAARARMKGKVIAVTGSVGKTSTKEMLATCFATYGKTHAAVASFNNHWGVPLTLARMPEDADFGIFEIGMNHSGEIVPLVALVQPHIAIITTVEPVHLAHFSGIEEIAAAKAEIFTGLKAGGTAILNADNPWFSYLCEQAKGYKIVSFGASEAADIQLLSCNEGVKTSLINYNLGAKGVHMAMNSLSVLGAIQACGLELTKAIPALEGLKPVKGRGEVVYLKNDMTLNDESYNANPASMKAAFAVLKTAKSRKIAALGDMLELGEHEIAIHEELAVDHEGIDLFYAQGLRMKAFYDALPLAKRGGYATTALELLPLLQAGLRPKDTLMVKGSLGSRMVDLVAKLKE